MRRPGNGGHRRKDAGGQGTTCTTDGPPAVLHKERAEGAAGGSSPPQPAGAEERVHSGTATSPARVGTHDNPPFGVPETEDILASILKKVAPLADQGLQTDKHLHNNELFAAFMASSQDGAPTTGPATTENREPSSPSRDLASASHQAHLRRNYAALGTAPRHSWLGCWAVRVCVRALRLYLATPGWGVRCGCVCLGSGCDCAPPLLAGVLGCVRVGVRALLVPRHSWLWCAVWLCVLELGFRLRPATPGWGVAVCVCLCARYASALPLLAGVCGVGVWLGSAFGCAPPLLAGVLGFVCGYVRAPLLPRHSRLRCAVWVYVFGLGLPLRPTTSGWGFRVCVCFRARSAWSPATPSWGVRCGCVCLAWGFDCAPPAVAGLLGCLYVCVCAPPVPCHSWLGCAVVLCALGLACQLRPATPGWGFGVCVCLCACSACTPPLLAGLRGVCVCVGARVSAAPRHS